MDYSSLGPDGALPRPASTVSPDGAA